jgi:signal transduction histidine kinase/CheY-like chemotaxis protein
LHGVVAGAHARATVTVSNVWAFAVNANLSAGAGATDAYILEARLKAAYDRLTVTSVVTIVNAALATAVLEQGRFSWGPWIWAGLVAVLGAARVMAHRIYRRDARKPAHVRLWAGVSIVGALASGLLWGLGSVALFSTEPTVQWLWIFLIAGTCAGSTVLFSCHLPTALAYTVPASAPMAVFLATRGTEQWLAASGMIAAFVFVVCFTGERSSRQFGQMLALQAVLERRTVELDEVNQRLSQEIEDHRATGETLRQAQKMEAIGSLTGGIAHDFNNLLTVIVGNLALIRDRAKDEGVVRLAKAALGAADRGARLTTSLLTFARKQKLMAEPVDLNDLVLDFATLLRRAAGDAVRLELSLSPRPCAARVDAAHFQGALLNLVINAKDSMPGGGVIVISTDTVDLRPGDLIGSDAPPGRFARVQVRDTGAGMTPEVAAKAFEPFFTTKAAGQGSGLGLSQVYGFARQSGGLATLASQPGQGTSVSIALPEWTEALPKTDGPPARPAAAKTGLRVLLVDDDVGVLTTLREGLADLGWEVPIAPDAETALGMLDRRDAIDVLVTDISMPGMSGTELARKVRQRRPELPILLMSGFPGAANDPGMEFEILQKPLMPDLLAARVSAAAGGRPRP